MSTPIHRDADPHGSRIVEDYLEAWIEEQAGSTAESDDAGPHDVGNGGDGTPDGILSQVFERARRCAELLQVAWPSPPGRLTDRDEAMNSGERTEPGGSRSGSTFRAGPEVHADIDGAPDRIGRFIIEEEIGRGRFGVVYRAHDSRLRREVAVKVARPEVAGRQDLNDRFLREAAAVARLDHPGIVPVHEAGESDGYLYYVMPFCDGENLAEWLVRQRGPVDQRTAAEIVRCAAEAANYGHARGVIHRDLKPANIMLVPAEGPGAAEPAFEFQPRVLDFGLSRSLEEELHDTRSSMIIGTPLYMSPEQARHPVGDVGLASDIFALGAILYELLTGTAPFAADTLPEIIERLKSCEPAPPGERRSDLDRRLETICLKCLRLYPEDRYESAQELADDLRRFLEGEPIRARRAKWIDYFRWWARHPRRIRDAGVALILVNVVISAGMIAVGLGPAIDPGGALPGWHSLDLIQAQVPAALAGLLIAWLGLRTIHGVRWALWLGTAGAGMQWGYCISILFLGAAAFSLYQDNPTAKWMVHVLLLLLFSLEVALCLAAIYAQAKRRQPAVLRRER